MRGQDMNDAYDIPMPYPLSYWVKKWENEEAPEALGTGFPLLDKALSGGLLPGQVLVVGASTGCGKSSFGVNLACRVAESGVPVTLFTFEMRVPALVARVNQTYSGVNANLIQTKEFSERDGVCVKDANSHMNKLPVYVMDGGCLTMENTATIMKRHKDEFGVGLFIFDYIQEMKFGDTESKCFGVENAVREIARIARAVVNVPVCLLSQLNRAAGKSGEPTVYDMRDTGAIENAADIVLFLDPVELKPVGGWQGPVQFNFIVAKQRSGGGATVPVMFIPHCVKFDDKE